MISHQRHGKLYGAFLSTLEPIMVRNFEALKTRLETPDDLRLQP